MSVARKQGAAGSSVDRQNAEMHLVERCRVQGLVDRFTVDVSSADASDGGTPDLNRDGEYDRQALERALPLRLRRPGEECCPYTRESATRRDFPGGESRVLLHGPSERTRRRVAEQKRCFLDRAAVSTQIRSSPKESSPEQERLRARQAVSVQRGHQPTARAAHRGCELLNGGRGRGVFDGPRNGP